MARLSKIRNVTVHYPTPENQDEFNRRATRAVAKVLTEIYPPEVIEKIMERLKKSNNGLFELKQI